MKHDLEANRRNATAFYRTAYLGDPGKAVDLYVGADYIQHNPLVGDGKLPFIDYFSEMAVKYPEKDIEFVLAVADLAARDNESINTVVRRAVFAYVARELGAGYSISARSEKSDAADGMP